MSESIIPTVPGSTWVARAVGIARELFPDTNDDYLRYILWNHTGFPCFFTGETEDDSAAQLRQQLEEYKMEVQRE
jgi:hypothetical protein